MLAEPQKRLFFALWPDATTRRQCGELIESLRCQARPVAPHNLHVTLVFLGQVSFSQQQAIAFAASRLSCPVVDLTFDRFSYWKKPAIGCLTASHADRNAAMLAGQLAEIARQVGLAVDERPYTPHVTLFRKLHAPLQVEFEPVHWQSKDFCLVESCSTEKGVEYRVLERWEA